MPVVSCTVDGLPAYRWSRSTTAVTYGPGTGRTAQDAARAAIAYGQRVAARRLVHDTRCRSDARRSRGPFRGRQPRFSDAVTRAYEAMLHEQVALTQRMVLQFAGPALDALQADLRDRRQDASPLDALEVLRVVRAALASSSAVATEGLRWLAGEIDLDVTDAVDRELSRLFTIPLATAAGSEELVLGWIIDNVSLISSIASDSLAQVENLVWEAMSTGTTTLDLRDQIQERFEVSRSRASLIARDQTAKLAAQISRTRHESYGITKYQWSTSGDSRVRQKHANLDGRIFSYAEGAPGGINPGEEFQCRCVDIAVLDEQEESAMVAAAQARQAAELVILQQSPTVQGAIPNYSGFTDWNASRIRALKSGIRSAVGLSA